MFIECEITMRYPIGRVVTVRALQMAHAGDVEWSNEGGGIAKARGGFFFCQRRVTQITI